MFKKIKKFISVKILKKKFYRKGNCLGCGSCCKKIYVRTSKHVIKDEEEFKNLRFLHRFYSYLTVVDKDDVGLVFSCSNLDLETNLCKIHKTRPGICRRYPQEALFDIGGELSEGCGFKMVPILSFAEVLKKEIANNKV